MILQKYRSNIAIYWIAILCAIWVLSLLGRRGREFEFSLFLHILLLILWMITIVSYDLVWHHYCILVRGLSCSLFFYYPYTIMLMMLAVIIIKACSYQVYKIFISKSDLIIINLIKIFISKSNLIYSLTIRESSPKSNAKIFLTRIFRVALFLCSRFYTFLT